MLATKRCQVIRFDESDARQMGRTAAGVRGIRFKEENDEVVGCITFDPEREGDLVLRSRARSGGRSNLDQDCMQRRGGRV